MLPLIRCVNQVTDLEKSCSREYMKSEARVALEEYWTVIGARSVIGEDTVNRERHNSPWQPTPTWQWRQWSPWNRSTYPQEALRKTKMRHDTSHLLSWQRPYLTNNVTWTEGNLCLYGKVALLSTAVLLFAMFYNCWPTIHKAPSPITSTQIRGKRKKITAVLHEGRRGGQRGGGDRAQGRADGQWNC